jgi:hypothetical protein
MENGVTTACNFGTTNSGINQHKMQTLGSGAGAVSGYIVRCGQGSVYANVLSVKYDGQAYFKFSHDKKMILADGFATVADPTSSHGDTFPVWSNISIGTTEILTETSGGANVQVAKSIYNSNGIYTFTSGNIFGISVGVQATSCVQVHVVNQFGANHFFTTIACPGYGPVFFNTSI